MIFNLQLLEATSTTHLMYICNICVIVDVFISVELYITFTHSTCSTSSANGNY